MLVIILGKTALTSVVLCSQLLEQSIPTIGSEFWSYWRLPHLPLIGVRRWFKDPSGENWKILYSGNHQHSFPASGFPQLLARTEVNFSCHQAERRCVKLQGIFFRHTSSRVVHPHSSESLNLCGTHQAENATEDMWLQVTSAVESAVKIVSPQSYFWAEDKLFSK